MSIPAVSVVIPCYNHAHFLPDAIGSVRAQTFTDHEILVVDDGSTDRTPQVAGAAGVRYVHQTNRGLAAARNTGIEHSRGALVTFLDADDLLRPHALATGAGVLADHPDCAFVSGRYRVVSRELDVLTDVAGEAVAERHYEALLRGNYIGMHATVMYRAAALRSVGGYDERLDACEDYDLYLRLARTHPVTSHGDVIADYRWHGGNMSADPRFMLRWALNVLRQQRPFTRSNPARHAAYRAGVRFWREYYAGEMRLLLEAGSGSLVSRTRNRIFVGRNQRRSWWEAP